MVLFQGRRSVNRFLAFAEKAGCFTSLLFQRQSTAPLEEIQFKLCDLVSCKHFQGFHHCRVIPGRTTIGSARIKKFLSS